MQAKFEDLREKWNPKISAEALEEQVGCFSMDGCLRTTEGLSSTIVRYWIVVYSPCYRVKLHSGGVTGTDMYIEI